MEINSYHKKFGIGSLALLISIFAILFSCYYTSNGVVLGEYIIGSTIPPGIVSLVMWGIAIHLGKEFPNHKWAKAGSKLSLAVIIISVAATLLTFIAL